MFIQQQQQQIHPNSTIRLLLLFLLRLSLYYDYTVYPIINNLIVSLATKKNNNELNIE